MNALKKKLNKNGGFTLVEMLIVVAIIAILIAVSIPLINNALERARDSTDQANERVAKAEANLVFMGLAADADGNPITDTTGDFWYDATNGVLIPKADDTNKPSPGYGKCTLALDAHKGTKPVFLSTGSAKHENLVLKVSIAEGTGKVTMVWN